MKKIIMLSIAALLTAGFIGCGSEEEDSSKADLKWLNKHDYAVSEIQWVDSTGSEDQKWSGEYAAGAPTDFKGIDTLTGSGECLFSDDSDGVPKPIQIDAEAVEEEGVVSSTSNGATVAENASAVLVIGGYAK